MPSTTSTCFALLMRPEGLPSRFSCDEEPARAANGRRGPSRSLRAVRQAIAALVVPPRRAGLPA